MLSNPILQFGTGRFLQAHVDLFVSEAIEKHEALGHITVVQSTSSATSTARTGALATGNGYPVHIRGLLNGEPVDQTRHCRSVAAALHAEHQWATLRTDVARGAVQVIVSNTGDSGWQLDDQDAPRLLQENAAAPGSFPAKLLVLLHDRWLQRPLANLTVLPCELVSRNGDTLRRIVMELGQAWKLPIAFIAYLELRVIWANSLVDRIVSAALHPVGAVTEPYALWAIERQPGLVIPCTHRAIVLTDQLDKYERFKLFLLNLGHTLLAEWWLQEKRPAGMTVLEAMRDQPMRDQLEAAWAEEVLPVFAALGERVEAEAYLVALRDRLLNPYLAHRLSDIAQNHAEKKQRRLAPVIALAEGRTPGLPQPRLRAALSRDS
jgi:tagaturonate reductase